MKTFWEYVNLMEKILKPERFQHSMGVAYTAASIAMRNGYEPSEFLIAGILHDCAKCYKSSDLSDLCKEAKLSISEDQFLTPEILHAPYGALLAETKYEVSNSNILDAIFYHSTGRPDMTFLEKTIFVSDFIEPSRAMDCKPSLSELRQMAYSDLDRCVYTVQKCTYDYVRSKNGYFAKEGLDTLKFYEKFL